MLFLTAGSSVLQFVQVTLIFGVVLIACIFVTRFVGNYQKGVTMNSNMQVIQMIKIGNNKFLQVVKVGDRYLVLGLSKDYITMLIEISEEEARKLEKKNTPPVGTAFSDIVNRFKDSLPKR